MSLLQANNLSVSIGQRSIFSKLDVCLNPGECMGILGANGAGKTTLLHVLAGLQIPQVGEVLVQDNPLSNYTRKNLAKIIGILFQDSHDSFPITVLESVLTGRYPHLPFMSMDTDEDISICMAVLNHVSLTDRVNHQIHTLSGGERRRLALATLIVQQPAVWLLDEPTNHLDLHYQITMLELIVNKVARIKGGIMMVLHDVNILTRFCSHALLMIKPDTQIYGEVAEVINIKNLEALYNHPIQCIKDGERLVYFPA
ncbi:MAG: iron complex transport system ATP-binding protein [Gammaproteobacteria bacterium]|jgi:iron complex transport system ATP-binding protein